MLAGEAKQWWKTFKNSGAAHDMDWATFVQVFYDRYFPEAKRDAKKKEFIELVQKGLTVSEYEEKFTALSRFAPDMVADEASKAKRFEWGLNPSIRSSLVPQKIRI